MLRYQLAAYSPVSGGMVIGGALGAVADRRRTLAALLMDRYAAAGCALCGSGTQALQVALRHTRARAGADASIALPAFSCYDVATAAIAVGGPVMLYDLDPTTLAPDADSLERVLVAGARIVVIAALYGMPVDWDALQAQATRHGAFLIEDAAQGHGGSWRQQALGSLGDVSTLSFGRGKGWTGGGGGAVLTRGLAGAAPGLDRGWSVSNELRTVLGLGAQWILGRPSLYGIPRSIPMLRLGETTYRAPRGETPMTRAGAAVVLRGRRSSDDEAVFRRKSAAAILAGVIDSARLQPMRHEAAAVPGYLRFPLRVSGGLNGLRDPARAQALGIAQSYPTTLAALPPLAAQLVRVDSSWPGAQDLARDLITIPTHSLVSDDERDEIMALLRKVDRPVKSPLAG